MKTTDEEAVPHGEGSEADRVWAEFMAALDLLPPQVRLAYLLHEVFEASCADIAALTGLPADACRRHVQRARAQVASRRHGAEGGKTGFPP